jgi:tetratricopeptide (TPR) repeat protein
VAAACVAIVGVASARVASRGAAASQSKPDSAPSLALAAPTTPDALPASPPAVTQHAEPSAAPARVVEAPPEPSETTRDPVEAKRKKRESQSLLERGKAGAAIDAGEAAVALDPEDAEAWLILGAAYQQKGDAKRAREAFSQCLKQGKRGPKAECAAMLR